jgi:hypothetical protein
MEPAQAFLLLAELTQFIKHLLLDISYREQYRDYSQII